jgi:sortase A
MISLGAFTLYFLVYQLVGTNAVTGKAQAGLRDQLSEQWAARGSGGQQGGGQVTRLPEKPVAEGKAFAIIRIPRIKVEQVLVEGTSRNDLRKGPGRISTSKLPGEAGTFAISGHRTTYGAPFFNLDKVRTGDQIIIETKNATYVYTMSRSKVVLPSETSVLKNAKGPDGRFKPTIVLTTCNPKFSAKERLVIFGDLADTRPPAGSVST